MVAWEYCDAVVPVDFVELKTFILIRIKISTVGQFLQKRNDTKALAQTVRNNYTLKPLDFLIDLDFYLDGRIVNKRGLQAKLENTVVDDLIRIGDLLKYFDENWDKHQEHFKNL